MKKLHFTVKGMTCSSCEVLIERGLKKVSGVEKVNVNRARETAEVECADAITVEQLQEAVKDKGYQLLDTAQPFSSKSFLLKNQDRLVEIGGMFLLMAGGYLLLKQLNFLPEGISVSENMGFGAAFLIGLVAAMSTCLAVAGGLLLSVAGKYNEKYPHLTGWQKFQPHISFNIGRIVSYTFLGGMVGLLGSVLTLSPQMTGILIILSSILMLIIGLQLLHIFP